jgi:nucleotide-binding universal stress UspA family protein
LLADAGTELILAYVRHATQIEHTREELEAGEAEALLDRGAEWLGDPYVEQRVVVSASTSAGLCQLAAQEQADIVVFGSDYRTAAGHVAPQQSAQSLLDCGSTALALAPSGYHISYSPRITAVGVLAAPGDDAAIATARDLAESFEARLTRDERHVDLLVVGSRSEAPPGRLMVSAHAQHEIENATCPVLVVPRGVTLRFPQLATI